MSEQQWRSLRLVMDLQACQTRASARRGVGRYTFELYRALSLELGDAILHPLLSDALSPSPPLTPDAVRRSLHLRPLPDWDSPRDFEGGERDTLDGLACAALAQSVKPDLVHVSHVFEGWRERVPLPSLASRHAGQVFSATLYDLIPLRFPDKYLRNPALARWFHARLAWLRAADLLLAISESSRQDAIEQLGIDPSRIVTIHGGVSPIFQPGNDPGARHALAQRYGLLRPRFVLYTGGDDPRKNLEGLIAGYALLPHEVRRTCQLVIVCAVEASRQAMYRKLAHRHGLAPDEVIMTGFVPDEDLIDFYRACDAFVFPSLYEGLGLPVLEAMACGAPVIGGDNSSIRELITRSDALCDASSDASIGGAIARVLTDRGFSEDLRRYGQTRAQDFSWQRTGRSAFAAFEEALARARTNGVQCAVAGWLPRRRLALFTPLPPCRSGIADYNAQFLPFLARHFDIDLYVDQPTVTDEVLKAAFRIYPVRDFEAVAQAYDAILYELGNSEFHAHMVPLLARYPGIVGLHDAYLGGLFRHLDLDLGDQGRYPREMLAAHGPLARGLFAPAARHPDADRTALIELPCTKAILDQALGVISHSPFNLKVARRYYPEGWAAPYRVIPQMVPVPPPWSDEERARARADLGFGPHDRIIGTFGYVAWAKWGDLLLEAFLGSALREDQNACLVYVGDVGNDDFGAQLKRRIKQAGLGRRIRVTGFVPKEDYERYLRITDVAVQLRTKSRGGTPKGVLDCLAFGVPVVVNNDASYTDYPDDVLIKLVAEPTPAALAEQLLLFGAVPEMLRQRAEAGLAYARRHHDPAQCAARYAAAIHEFIARGRQRDREVAELAPHLAGCADPSTAVQQAARWLQEIPERPVGCPRLLLLLGRCLSDKASGDSVMSAGITAALYRAPRAGFEPVAVGVHGGALQPARAWLEGLGLLLPGESTALEDVALRPGDRLLVLDPSVWNDPHTGGLWQTCREIGAPVYTFAYPQAGDGAQGEGRDPLDRATALGDGLICASEAAARDLAATRAHPPATVGGRTWGLPGDVLGDGTAGQDWTGVAQALLALIFDTIGKEQ